MKHNCYKCKYYKFYLTRYCSKQESIIYKPELECEYYDRGILGKIVDRLWPPFPEKERSKNCKK